MNKKYSWTTWKYLLCLSHTQAATKKQKKMEREENHLAFSAWNCSDFWVDYKRGRFRWVVRQQVDDFLACTHIGTDKYFFLLRRNNLRYLRIFTIISKTRTLSTTFWIVAPSSRYWSNGTYTGCPGHIYSAVTQSKNIDLLPRGWFQ